MTNPDDQVLAWCVGCRRYLGVLSQERDAVVRAAQKHTRATGHGFWLETTGPYFTGRSHAARKYDPARRDDRREEIQRGGV